MTEVEIVPVGIMPEDVHRECGRFWHLACAAMMDEGGMRFLRDFPSKGQLIPDTIMHDDNGNRKVLVWTCATCGKQWKKGKP